MIELCSGYLSECGFTLKRVRHMTRTYSQMHCTNKYSEHSSVIWPVRPNGLVFLYELSGSGFEFICRISKDSLLLHLLSCKSLIFVKENPDRKKNKLCFRTCKNRLSVCDGWRASWLFQWRRSLSYRNQTIDFQNKSVDWFLYDRGIRHERVHPLLLTFIHQDILLDYDKLCIWHLRI